MFLCWLLLKDFPKKTAFSLRFTILKALYFLNSFFNKIEFCLNWKEGPNFKTTETIVDNPSVFDYCLG